MSMRAIISLVEGEGDQKAVPTLIHKILSDLNKWDWYAPSSIRVHGLDKLRKQLGHYLSIAARTKNCAAILIALDLDDGCPFDSVEKLVPEIRFSVRVSFASLNLAQPVAIVFAHREYEAWFLASLPSLVGHYGLAKNLVYEGEPEAKRGAKEWLKYQMSPKSNIKRRFTKRSSPA